ncbi:hypothetical protein PP899_gp75 [Agrobacterium phage Atu_ph08]|uniref:Uncharacterized protein n=1 Tax=Agrobacterium phage Atu_ph08 TaxID=2024265 RepID=A0A2L0V0Z2_9CAUD|nr:hypothetical protein PP899_gp75 [Agrobacterium phage Atu_ph08]AUZ95492.1 hypothetical protein [Agrobacterium phage Atu_ph08]
MGWAIKRKELRIVIAIMASHEGRRDAEWREWGTEADAIPAASVMRRPGTLAEAGIGNWMMVICAPGTC